MITHTVIFRLNRPEDRGRREQFIGLLQDFGKEPPHGLGPAKVHQDLQLRPEGRSVGEVLMEVRFADAEAFQRYLADPKHQELVSGVLAAECESWLSVQTETA